MDSCVECPRCQGWMPDETGWTCDLCGGSGMIWDEPPDDTEQDNPAQLHSV